MNFSNSLLRKYTFRSLIRHSNSLSKNVSKIRVSDYNEDEHLKFTFKFSNSPYLTIKAPKNESVQKILSRIKLMAQLQLQKEDIWKSCDKNCSSATGTDKITFPNEVNVCLTQNENGIDLNLRNCDVWPQASTLTIGNVTYEVNYNMPSVKSLGLPDFIVSDCVIRPHCILECATFEDSVFTWYRSITEEQATKLLNETHTEILLENGKYWLKVHEGFLYFTCAEDAGCFLKVVCIPKEDDVVGNEHSAESIAVVESAPRFPFEERQENTKSFCGDDEIRCLSYNILANIYVEKKKFPYSSEKARDIYYRKQILLKELMGYKNDIICLQEVQERIFEFDILPFLNHLGYTGFHKRKGSHRSEGLATFFRSSKFRLKLKKEILLNQIIKEKHIYMDFFIKVAGNYKDMAKLLIQDTALQVLCLEHRQYPERKLVVANTHLYSNKDMPEVRLLQAAVCTHYIEHIVKQENLQSAGILFCGDFNSLPDSSAYHFIISGSHECCPTWQCNSGASMDLILKHNLCFESACGTPEYTNYTEAFSGCLDYIFYCKDNLKVTDRVPMPKHEHVTAQVGLPNEYFPSDHIALVCTLQWKNS